MPDTKPSAAAVRLIESIAKDLADALDAYTPGKTEAQLMHEWAQRADAYAAERIEDATDGDRTFARLATVERERDAALARAEAAELWFIHIAASVGMMVGGSSSVDIPVTPDDMRAVAEEVRHRLHRAEERVRVLEAALEEQGHGKHADYRHDFCRICAVLNAKAAAEEERG